MKVCIYHSPCADGFTAAWVFNKKYSDITFVEGIYGQDPPDVTGKDVFIVDFSYKRPVLEDMLSKSNSLVVLDHHKTAKELLDGLEGCLFDMNRSGAMLAWDYCFIEEKPPKLVEYVQDRDLWKFELPFSKEINAVIFSHTPSFKTWDDLNLLLEEDFDALVGQGTAIIRKQNQDINAIVKSCLRSMVIGGEKVPTVNMPFTLASDAGMELAKSSPCGYAALYYDTKDNRKFSLRGNGEIDVAKIAETYGGGGHHNASAFIMPIGWEGDNS